MIKRSFDKDAGIIYVTGTGLWTQTAVDEHYCELRQMIQALRAEGKPIRVLSDVTRAPRQGHSLESRILSHIENTFHSGDRIAVLTADTADKHYVKTLTGKGEIAAFASRIPAEQWLLLDDLRLAG